MPKNMNNIPPLVRIKIYAYLDILTLLNTIRKVSKQDQLNLLKSENLDQKRCLKINFKN